MQHIMNFFLFEKFVIWKVFMELAVRCLIRGWYKVVVLQILFYSVILQDIFLNNFFLLSSSRNDEDITIFIIYYVYKCGHESPVIHSSKKIFFFKFENFIIFSKRQKRSVYFSVFIWCIQKKTTLIPNFE